MTTRREFLTHLSAGILGGTAALGLVGTASLWPGSANNKTKTLPVEIGKDVRKGYAEVIRETVNRMAQDAIGKPEKSEEMSLLKEYVDLVQKECGKNNVQFGYGTFTGPRSDYITVVDSIHWLFYGEWGTVRDPIYWAQRNDNGQWYII